MEALFTTSSLEMPIVITITAVLLIIVTILYVLRAESDDKATPASYPIVGSLFSFLRNRSRLREYFTELMITAPSNTIKFHRLGMRNARRVASYEFSTRSLRDFIAETVQREIADRLLPLLRKSAESTDEEGNVRRLDMQEVLKRFGFDNICKVAFGTDPGCLDISLPVSEFAEAFDVATDLIVKRFFHPVPFAWKVMRRLNVGSEKRFKGGDTCGSQLRGGGEQRHNFRRAHPGFFWLVSTHPHVEQQIEREIARLTECKEEGTSGFSYEELKEMNYLHASICESMRLYPPVPSDTKEALQDDVLPDGTTVRKGTR
ncbi:hypothetical protein KI387_017342, partial [Taxus chinensis]